MCTDDQIQIDELDAMIEEKDKRIAELEAELANWKDMGAIAHTTALNHYDLLRKADADNARLRERLKRIADLTVEGKSAIEYVISGIAQEGLE